MVSISNSSSYNKILTIISEVLVLLYDGFKWLRLDKKTCHWLKKSQESVLEVAKITDGSPSYLTKEKFQETVPEESCPPCLA